MRLTRIFLDFFESEKIGGVILILCTLMSLYLANSPMGTSYISFLNSEIGGHSFAHWVNEGLMTIFFLLIGLELEREIYGGELSTLKNAMLPVVAALGGMVMPALCFYIFNKGTPYISGSGIPTATDIAFALGIMSLLGNRIPPALKIFLAALAVIDDLGAIVIIALFYAGQIIWLNLAIALGIFVLLLILNRLKVHNLTPYLVAGPFMWYFMSKSGVHATISGVLFAFALPYSHGGEKSASYILQKFLHKPVAFFVLPVFAMVNTAILLTGSVGNVLTQSYGLGISSGLVIGKPLGIVVFSVLAVSLRWCKLPFGVNWRLLIGAGMLGGIGFTMSIFITQLAYTNQELINNSKLVVLIASSVSALLGLLWLGLNTRSQKKPEILK